MSAAAADSRGRFAGVSPIRTAWHGFANQMHGWSWALVALLLLGLPGMTLLHSAHAGVVTLALLMLPAGIGLWAQLVSSILQQNHPMLARLLPHQPRRLRLNLVLSFLALGTVSAIVSVALHKPGLAPFCIVAIVYVAIGARWPLAWATTGLVGFGPLVPRYLPDHVNDFFVNLFQAAGAPLGLACLLAAGAVFLASFVRDGGRDHEAAYERLLKRRRAIKASMAGEAIQSGWLGRFCLRGYQRSFARALERARHGKAGFERVLLALGPQAHPSATSQGLMVLAAIVAVVIALLKISGNIAYSEQFGQGLANSLFGLIGVLISSVMQLQASVIRRRHEQSLMSLLPGLPRGREFNRQLALALMRHYLTLWAVGLAAMTLALGSLEGTHAALIVFGTTLLGGGLVLWRDWTSAALVKGWLAFLIYLPLMAVAEGARLAVERGMLGIDTFLLAAALVLVPLYAWRWRVALRAPMAWPAGRRG